MADFQDTFDEVQNQKSAAAGEAPSSEEITSTETPSAVESTSTETQEAIVETQTDESARGVEKTDEAQPTTEDETQFNLTGLETPESLQAKHGDTWMPKTARKHLALVKEAGGSAALRQGAQLIAEVHNGASGAQILDRIAAISKDRAQEIKRDIFWSVVDTPGGESPDGKTVPSGIELALRDKLPEFPGLTLDFVRQAVANELQYGSQAEPIAETTDEDDLSSLSPALRKEIEESREMRKRFPQIEQELTGFREERKTEQQQKREEQEYALGSKLRESVFSVVEERKSKLKLDVLPTDSPRIAGIKHALSNYLSPEKIEAAFESNEDNMKIAESAIGYVKRLDEQNAFSFRDALAVGAEMTFEGMLKSPEVSSLLEALKSEMESQSTPKNPTARTETVQGTNAGFSTTDPYDEGAKHGLRPFDVAVQRAGQSVGR